MSISKRPRSSLGRPAGAMATALIYISQLMAGCGLPSRGNNTGQIEQAIQQNPPQPPQPNQYPLLLTEHTADDPTRTVGEIAFTHSVSVDGSAEISIPIWVPPGRRGM